MAKEEYKLNERQRRFANEYAISGNAYQSAISAGYSEKYAKAQSHRLLENVGIKKAIEERNKVVESEKIADMKEVKEFWSNLLRDDENDVKDRLKASEYIAKTQGAFIDKQDVNMTGDLGIKVLWTDEDD